jgi:hypothetical protein
LLQPALPTMPKQISETEEAAAFTPPLRRLVSLRPATRLGLSVVFFFAGARAGAALDSGLLVFVTICASGLGATSATVGVVRQLLRRARNEGRGSDHSLVVLLVLLAAGIFCLAAFALWMLLLFAGNPAD